MKITRILGILLLSIVLMAGKCAGDTSQLDDARDNLTHSWHAELAGEDFEVKIEKDEASSDKIFILNYINTTHKAEAIVTGKNLTVAEQTVGNQTVSADGVISDDYQSITWVMLIDGEEFTCEYKPGGITKNLEL